MSIKESLIGALKKERCFWSFADNSVCDVPDDIVIEKKLVYTVQGILIGTRNPNNNLSLPPGTYIIKHSSKTVKHCF